MKAYASNNFPEKIEGISCLLRSFRNATTKKIRKNEILFSENTKPTGFYYLCKGNIGLYKTDEEGRDQVFKLVTPGYFLGLSSVIKSENYQSTAIANENCEVCYIPECDYDTLIHTRPEAANELLTWLTRLATDEEANPEINSALLKDRLYKALLFIAVKNIGIGIEDLTRMMDFPANDIRFYLSGLKRKKVVNIENKKIFVLDKTRLNIELSN